MMQKRKVLIIGATGMLGHVVYKYLDSLDLFDMYNSVYRAPLNDQSIFCNVRNQESVVGLIQGVNPDIVINCVGALISESTERPSNAIYLNAYFPHILKDLCSKRGAKLIHVSTDCVFSGNRGAYSEIDFRDADDVYGRSKALGEIFDSAHCTLRTSIIGPELKDGTGLFHWFMNQSGVVKGYTRAYWSGVTTLELAKAIYKVIEFDLSGLLHVTNGARISKYDLLRKFNKYRETELIIEPYDDYIIDKSLRKSMRFDFMVPSYDMMLDEQNDCIVNKFIGVNSLR